MTSPSRIYLHPVEPTPVASSRAEHRARFFGSGAPTREASGGRAPPLKAYARLQRGPLRSQLRVRHAAILALAAAVIVFARSQGI